MVIVKDPNGNKIATPDRWSNCSTRIFQRIIYEWQPELAIKDRSRLLLFSILIDKPEQLIAESSDPALEAALYECTRFVYEDPTDFTKLPVPEEITIAGVPIKLKRDLGRMTIGQNIHVRGELNDNALVKTADDKLFAKRVSTTAAIYLQPQFDAMIQLQVGKMPFDFDSAKQLEQIILEMPITEVYPVGFFFLNQLYLSGQPSLKSWSLTTLRRTLAALRSLTWRRSTGSPIQS